MSDSVGDRGEDSRLGVSRETEERLSAYSDLISKWTRHINLISKSDHTRLWERHILDSAQLIEHLPEQARTWVDLGSGGGLPGLVIGILAREIHPGLNTILIESDTRKSAFLRTAIAHLNIPATVLNTRIEHADPQNADVLSARALAPLSDLLEHASRHTAKSGICLFPKGQSYNRELTEARRAWHVDPEVIVSKTNPEAVILKIGEFSRA